MSRINGDKSRFHRERKQNIHRRMRTRELIEAANRREEGASAASKSEKPRPKQAA